MRTFSCLVGLLGSHSKCECDARSGGDRLRSGGDSLRIGDVGLMSGGDRLRCGDGLLSGDGSLLSDALLAFLALVMILKGEVDQSTVRVDGREVDNTLVVYEVEEEVIVACMRSEGVEGFKLPVDVDATECALFGVAREGVSVAEWCLGFLEVFGAEPAGEENLFGDGWLAQVVVDVVSEVHDRDGG